MTVPIPKFINPYNHTVGVITESGSKVYLHSFADRSPNNEAMGRVYVLEGYFYRDQVAPRGSLAPFPESAQPVVAFAAPAAVVVPPAPAPLAVPPAGREPADVPVADGAAAPVGSIGAGDLGAGDGSATGTASTAPAASPDTPTGGAASVIGSLSGTARPVIAKPILKPAPKK